jgi:hypothetical protein
MNKKNFNTVKVQHVLCTAFPEAKSHNRVSRNFFWKQSGKVLIVKIFLNRYFNLFLHVQGIFHEFQSLK